MASVVRERVTSIHHWNEQLFSFKTTRAADFRFENGHFVMLGLEVDGKPLMRAYSIASANYDPELEFFSIKVADGPLTSRLQNIAVGDQVLVSTKPTGTLVADHLFDGKNLYLVSTGTGLAPFLSIIRDPAIYDRFERIILTHGVRQVSELAYRDVILEHLPRDEYLGELVREKLIYYPTVTREQYPNQGRVTDLLKSGQLNRAIGLPTINPDHDRFMICGSPTMLKDTCAWLHEEGFTESRHGHRGHFVIERAFVEK